MSTTGHYTRYINQYPGWSDNCDTMHKPVHSPLEGECQFCKYDSECKHDHHNCYLPLGSFQVVHYAGNKHAWCTFDSFDYTGNKAPGSRFYMHVYSYTGKKAIQNVLDYMRTFPVETLIEMILKYRFNNRSYMDYFDYFVEVSPQ